MKIAHDPIKTHFKRLGKSRCGVDGSLYNPVRLTDKPTEVTCRRCIVELLKSKQLLRRLTPDAVKQGVAE